MEKISDFYVGKSKIAGLGIFTKRNFKTNDILFRCPVIIIPPLEVKHLDKTILDNYQYTWGDGSAIALGFASLLNHSYKPNAMYKTDLIKKEIIIIAICPIKRLEEITINYNGKIGDKTPVEF